MVAQVDARVVGPEEVQRQRNVMLDASSREPLLHLFEVGVFTRAEVIHEHAYLDSTAGGAVQGCEDGFGLLVAAGREIFEVDELLGSIDVCGDARKDGVVLGRSEEHTSELQSQSNLVCRLLLEKK